MSEKSSLTIEPLAQQHNKHSFCCGVASLDHYIQRQATQDIKRLVARVFVATTASDKTTVLGYYTLSALSIELVDLPADKAKKLPKHPIPAALLGRLAVSKIAQGNGVGALLIADAVKRVLSISDTLAVYALVLDAIDYSASAYYRQFGFVPFEQRPLRLYLPLIHI